MRPFKEILVELQEDKNMNTADLCRKSGLSRNALTKLRNGSRSSPSRETIGALAKALRVTPARFF